MTAPFASTRLEMLADVTDLEVRGWQVVRKRGWIQCSPPGATLQRAGWKVHVSADADHFTAVIDALRGVAVEFGLVFKFLPTVEDALRSNSKGMLRSVSGKLGCIYAGDEEMLERVVADLRGRTRGIDGPDILTDLRCGPEPVFIRYGAFEEVWTFSGGQRRLGLRDPDGNVVVDEGRSRWTLPPWVALPVWAGVHVEERNARRTNLPCGLRRALHFSNAGGVYEGIMRPSGEAVLVKEGRPFTALDGDGVDAASRLEIEYRRLQALQGTGLVPRVFGFHRGTRHSYLVREMLSGETLGQRNVARWPWHSDTIPGTGELASYEAWALDMLDETARLLDAVHGEGLLVHDLHPGNLFLTDGDETLKLFDLETLTSVSREGMPPLIVPDYLAPPDVLGTERDRYAYRALAHALFSPTVAGWTHSGRRAWVRRWIHDHFGPATLAHLDARTLDGEAEPLPWSEPACGLVQGLDHRANAGEPFTAASDDCSLSRGLAGILAAQALHPSAAPAPDLVERLCAALPALALRDPSLSTGAAGVALALGLADADFDRDDWATRTAEHIRAEYVEPHLWHGIAGVALTLGVLRQRSASDWNGGDALLDSLLPRLTAVEPGHIGGGGLLLGDAGLGLAWNVLGSSGIDGAYERAGRFLTPPPVGNGPGLGGMEGVGGWFTALAAGPAPTIDAVRDVAVGLAHGGLRHRDGGLAHGLGGTLMGLELSPS